MSVALTSRASLAPMCGRPKVARSASFDLLYSRKSEVLATPALLRSLSQNCSEAADAPPHRCPWAHMSRKQVLARESHGAFSLPRQLLKVNGRATVGWNTVVPLLHDSTRIRHVALTLLILMIREVI